MKFSDYFANDFETTDGHYLPSLRTRYYRATKDNSRTVVLEIIKQENGKILDDNEAYSEILYETPYYSCICTLSNPRSMGETAIDLKVTTNSLIPMGKGKKIIERLYEDFDAKLTYVTSGACR